MTLDEAIKLCEERAEEVKESLKAGSWEQGSFTENRLKEYVSENKQLAGWLKDLKEAKRLLKLAVEDFKTLVLQSTELCNMKILCDKCPLNCTNDNLGWKKEAESLRLIGE